MIKKQSKTFRFDEEIGDESDYVAIEISDNGYVTVFTMDDMLDFPIGLLPNVVNWLTEVLRQEIPFDFGSPRGEVPPGE